MATIGWNESVPSNTSRVRDFPAFMRSVTTAMATALGTEALYWTPTSGSAASVGEMQPGGSRTFFGARSSSSNSNNAKLGQRLLATSDTTELLCYDSAGTYRVGTPYFVEVLLGPAISSTENSMKTATWVVQSGSSVYPVAGGTNQVTVTYPTAYSRRPPAVHVSVGGSSIGVEWMVSISTHTTGGATFDIHPTPGYGPGTNPTVYWSSLGTVGGLV
jgi:hypothetical protein